MRDTGLEWDLSSVTYSDRDLDGYPIVQQEAYGGEGGAPLPLQHQYGSYSRPHDPAPGNDGREGWCTLWVAKDGSTHIGLLGYDPRFLGLIPLPPKGSSMNYAAFKDGEKWRASFAFISGDTGTYQYYLPVGDSALAVTYGTDANGHATIDLRHPDGSTITMFKGKTVLKCPNGKTYIQVSDDGIVLKGPITQMGGLSTPGGVSLTYDAAFQQLLTVIEKTLDGMIVGTGTAFKNAFETALLGQGLVGTGTTVTKGL